MVESVYCAVRTDSLYKVDYISSLKGYLTSSFTYVVITAEEGYKEVSKFLLLCWPKSEGGSKRRSTEIRLTF